MLKIWNKIGRRTKFGLSSRDFVLDQLTAFSNLQGEIGLDVLDQLTAF
jgi:hypothetical protein